MQPPDLQHSTGAKTAHVLGVHSMDEPGFCCYDGLTWWRPT